MYVCMYGKRRLYVQEESSVCTVGDVVRTGSDVCMYVQEAMSVCTGSDVCMYVQEVMSVCTGSDVCMYVCMYGK